MVEVEQPAEPRPPSHPGRWPHRRWRAAQQLVLKTLMVPLPVVVLDILVDKLSEVSLTPYGANKRPRLGRCWSSLPSSLRLCRLRCSSSSSRSLAG